MTPGFGIKISRPGFDVNTAADRELAFSSKFKTLKIESQGNGTLTHGARTATIPHNLGYVPFFLVHTQLDETQAPAALSGNPDDYFISPFRLPPIEIYEATNTHDIIAWADSTNLYIRARENVGWDIYPFTFLLSSPDDTMAYESDTGYTTGMWFVGNDPPLFNVEHGALRTFGGVTANQGESVVEADLNIYVGSRLGSGEVKMTIYGIDEDNTADFDTGTAATARTKTTANTVHNTTVSSGQFTGANVTSIVNEILGRAGWVTGNKMGFIMNDNGTGADNDYGEVGASNSNLAILRSNNLVSYKYTIFKNQLV